MGQMIKVAGYWVAVFDQFHHVPFHVSSGHDLRDQSSLFLRVSHLPLGVVEKVLVQLSICQSYDDAGSAITCTQKDSDSCFAKSNGFVSSESFCGGFLISTSLKIETFCASFSVRGAQRISKPSIRVSCFLEL